MTIALQNNSDSGLTPSFNSGTHSFMLGLSLGHLIILSLVVLLFGHKRLPELGHALGKGMGAFKKGLEGKNTDDDESDPKQLPQSTPTNHKIPPL